MGVRSWLLVSALLVAPAIARADVMYDVSISDGIGDGITATLDIGSTPSTYGGYDTANAWTIKISKGTGFLSNATGLTLTDPYGSSSSYIYSSAGIISDAYLYEFRDTNDVINFYSYGPGVDNTTIEDFRPYFHSFEADASFALVPVPEPGSIALLGLGGIAAIVTSRRRRRV